MIGNAVDEYILYLNAILNENIYWKQTTPVFTCVLWLNYNGNFWDKALLWEGNQPIFPFMRKQRSPQILFQTASLLALITLFSFLCEKQSWCHSEESANLFQDHLEFSEFCENPCEERRWIKSWITVQLPFNFLIFVPAPTPFKFNMFRCLDVYSLHFRPSKPMYPSFFQFSIFPFLCSKQWLSWSFKQHPFMGVAWMVVVASVLDEYYVL